MTTEGWIFMVGFRVFDVGLLIVWLIWFFRLRDDGEDSPGEDGGGGEGPDPSPEGGGPGGDGMQLPLGRWGLGRGRVRDHSRPRRPGRRRGPEPARPGPVPSRVRRPRSPLPTHRNALGRVVGCPDRVIGRSNSG